MGGQTAVRRGRQVRQHASEAFAHLLPCPVDVGAFFEIERDVGDRVLGFGTQDGLSRNAEQLLLDRSGDPRFDLVGRHARGLHDDLDLRCGNVRKGIDRQARAQPQTPTPDQQPPSARASAFAATGTARPTRASIRVPSAPAPSPSQRPFSARKAAAGNAYRRRRSSPRTQARLPRAAFDLRPAPAAHPFGFAHEQPAATPDAERPPHRARRSDRCPRAGVASRAATNWLGDRQPAVCGISTRIAKVWLWPSSCWPRDNTLPGVAQPSTSTRLPGTMSRAWSRVACNSSHKVPCGGRSGKAGRPHLPPGPDCGCLAQHRAGASGRDRQQWRHVGGAAESFDRRIGQARQAEQLPVFAQLCQRVPTFGLALQLPIARDDTFLEQSVVPLRAGPGEFGTRPGTQVFALRREQLGAVEADQRSPDLDFLAGVHQQGFDASRDRCQYRVERRIGYDDSTGEPALPRRRNPNLSP